MYDRSYLLSPPVILVQGIYITKAVMLYVLHQYLRGAIVNRTYGTNKNLYTSLFLLTIFGPIYYGPP